MHHDLEPTDSSVAKTMGLSADEWDRIIQTLGRTPNFAELGVFSAMWSEHCSYKSSRKYLKQLPTTGPKVVQGPGENAGAVDIGDGHCAVFKMESHNHPSFIEPYQGAATGVGGILRDVFTMGARPVALLNSLRFGEFHLPKTQQLLKGVVAGIAGYGNCIGVPTVGGEIYFDKSYNGNCLVNAFALGVARTDRLFFGKATGIGNPLVYIGARTGRDGVNGAIMASESFSENSAHKLPTVQVGDPFKEKLLLEACLEMFNEGCLEGIQDMGAAGLTSATVEMASRAGTGVELHLDAIPRRTVRLSAYEMLLSESQERMLLVCRHDQLDAVKRICARYELDVAVVGKVTDTGRFVCTKTETWDPYETPNSPEGTRPCVVVDLPVDALTEAAPVYDRPVKPMPKERRPDRKTVDVDASDSFEQKLERALSSPNIGSRNSVWRQYDHIVRVGTVLGPGQADAAVIRVFTEDEKEKYLALSVDCNPFHVGRDPYHGAAMAVAECARNIVCSGAQPLGLTDCLNFGAVTDAEVMWQLTESIRGIRDACTVLGIPVVSGNVSLYNQTGNEPILPTPTVAIVGQLERIADRRSIGFVSAEHGIALLYPKGSEHTHEFEINLQLELKLQKFLLQAIREGYFASVHDVSDGGLAVALAECCLGATGNFGCEIDGASEIDWFSETPSRVFVSYAPESHAKLTELCASNRIVLNYLGKVSTTPRLAIKNICDLPIDLLKHCFESALNSIA